MKSGYWHTDKPIIYTLSLFSSFITVGEQLLVVKLILTVLRTKSNLKAQINLSASIILVTAWGATNKYFQILELL